MLYDQRQNKEIISQKVRIKARFREINDEDWRCAEIASNIINS